MGEPHGKKGNPNPTQSELFKQKRFHLEDEKFDHPLGKKNQTCRVPIDYEMALESLTEGKASFLRRALMRSIEEELSEYLEAARSKLDSQKKD